MRRAMPASPISSPHAAIHVYAHDHRGHGYTTAPDAPRGRFAASDGSAKVIADVDAVHDRIAADHPGLPVVVFGHSMGALIALNFVLAHSLAHPCRRHLERQFLGRASPAARHLPSLPGKNSGSAPTCLRASAETHLPGLEPPGRREPHRLRLAVARPRRGRQIRRRPALRLGRLGVAVARPVRLRLRRRRTTRSFAAVRRDLPFHLVGGSADPSTDGGKAVTRLAGRMRGDGLFESRFNDLRRQPPRKPERAEPRHRHGRISPTGLDGQPADMTRVASWPIATAVTATRKTC